MEMLTLSSDVQPEKALLPIEVTELGMEILVRDEQPEKALSPMEVTVFGMTLLLQPNIKVLLLVSMMALQLSLLSKTGLSVDTIMETREEQLPNALLPIVVTVWGIVTPVR